MARFEVLRVSLHIGKHAKRYGHLALVVRLLRRGDSFVQVAA
jgi:hypothetical protein